MADSGICRPVFFADVLRLWRVKWAAIFWSFQRCVTGLGSGLRLVHSRTFSLWAILVCAMVEICVFSVCQSVTDNWSNQRCLCLCSLLFARIHFCLYSTLIYIQNLFGWGKKVITHNWYPKQNKEGIQTRRVFILSADITHNSSLQSGKKITWLLPTAVCLYSLFYWDSDKRAASCVAASDYSTKQQFLKAARVWRFLRHWLTAVNTFLKQRKREIIKLWQFKRYFSKP